MVLTPHNDGGGTLHLPSPTHCHTLDATAAIAQIRRSLSRSPSRRSQSPKLNSPKLGSPLSPTPSSPNLRSHPVAHSPLAIPYPPSAKKARSTIRKPSPMRPTNHGTNSRRLALEESSGQGNALPHSSAFFNLARENCTTTTTTTPEAPPPYQSLLMDPSKEPGAQVPNHVFSRKDRHEVFADAPVRSSPLKRTDRSTNNDLSHSGSPSAKRRSLHGVSFGPDFNIFDQYTASEASAAPAPVAQETTAANALETTSQPFSPILKRSSSLRKAALQQRHEKPLRLRTGSETGGDSQAPNPTRSSRLRLSLDSYQPSREGIFSQSNAPDASLHPPPAANRRGPANPPQRHPLSRTLTQSSSSSSLVDDSPTHVPIRQPEVRRARLDFSKSLPLHAARPAVAKPLESVPSSQETNFATPDNYKFERPLAVAFMSTGLISKKNRNLGQEQLDARGSIGHMPDTPCKRPVSLAAISPSAGLPLNQGSARPNRHTMHSFGTPSTPFNPHTSGLDVAAGQSAGVFGGSFNGNAPRRGSFAAEDISVQPSPSYNVSTRRANARVEIPPTPTKQVQAPVYGQSFSFRSFPDAGEAVNSDSQNATEDAGLGLTSFFESSSSEDEPEATNWDEVKPPFSITRQRSFSSNDLGDGESEGPPQAQSPTPKTRHFHTLPLSRRRGVRMHQSLASPNFSRVSRVSPKTPADMVPPDPSGLSISANARSQSMFADALGHSMQSLPPVTPTANRDSFPRLSLHRSTLTPVHHAPAAEIDESMMARFEKVEVVGSGEFSTVFRVVGARDPPSQSSSFSGSPQRLTPTRTWAVKKSKAPYSGRRDRRRKLQEVEILHKLGRSDHTLHIDGSWEYGHHLYIQTEYCEEGSLDVFLDRVGRNARLDDFRIWKILLELSEGLGHIHDRGVIHLDIKPANILITFEGVLKIADFGMAAHWPAATGIEGEGDREYIAPEILQSKFDKPADVFALGLVMLEIAGNVMLPENGVSWQRLRSGDMSDVPSLTSSSLGTTVSRDASGQPLPSDASTGLMRSNSFSEDPIDDLGITTSSSFTPKNAASPRYYGRPGELFEPPAFMKDSSDEGALDALVRWMIAPEPARRPLPGQLLATAGVSWVRSRRRAGATVYEGNWGPADDVLQHDSEMIDV